MKTFKDLLRAVLKVSDNNTIYGRAKYNLMDRAIMRVINQVTDTTFTDKEKDDATAYLALIQAELGSQAYKLKSVGTRIQLDL